MRLSFFVYLLALNQDGSVFTSAVMSRCYIAYPAVTMFFVLPSHKPLKILTHSINILKSTRILEHIFRYAKPRFTIEIVITDTGTAKRGDKDRYLIKGSFALKPQR